MKKRFFLIGFIFTFLLPSILFSQSLLWEVMGKKSKKPSYIYGTIHIQDKRVFEYSDSVEIAINACDAFALELLLDEIDQKDMIKHMMMKESLEDLMEKEDYDFLKKTLKEKYGIGIAMFNNMKPFFLSSQLSMLEIKSDMADALDLYLLKIARKKDKKCYGIEKFSDQIAAVDRITIPEQIKMLMDAVKDTADESSSKTEELIGAYLKMDLEEMVKLTQDTTMPAEFEKAFLIDRNIKMVKSIGKKMRKSPIFVAIGAAHLGGENGVLNLMRKRGYKIRAVEMNFDKIEK